MPGSRPGRVRLGRLSFQAHLHHQPPHPLAARFPAQSPQPVSHLPRSEKGAIGVDLIDFPHQFPLERIFALGLVVGA